MDSRDVFLIGVGMTRFGDHRGRTLADLAGEAVRDALSDAGCAIPDVEAIWFANAGLGALAGQHMIRGQTVLRPNGFEGVAIFNVENACASGATAFHGAMNHILAGGDVALAVGAEKLVHDDKTLALNFLKTGIDVAREKEQLEAIAALDGSSSPTAGAGSLFMDIYAAVARQHMRMFGTTVADLAAVTCKNRRHAVSNERAHFRKEIAADDVIAARMIAAPLTLPMCAPVSDGAAACLLASRSFATRIGAIGRAVRVDACVLRTGAARDSDDWDRHIGRQTALAAYERAGVASNDVNVAEVHDAASIAEIIQIENLGIAPRGEGGPRTRLGETSIGGRCPVNSSGGLAAKGHPIAATGLAQIFELALQLRGEAGPRQIHQANLGVAENGGGFIGFEEAVCAVSVLSK